MRTTRADDAPVSKDGDFHIRCIFPKDEAESQGGKRRTAGNLKHLNKLRWTPYIFEIKCLIFFLAATSSSSAALNRTDIYSAKTR